METETITQKEVIEVIKDYLGKRLNEPTRLPKEERALERLKEQGDEKAITKQEVKIRELKERFILENWLEDALNRRIGWIDLATHTTKGVHPDSKGNNVLLELDASKAKNSPYVSSHCISQLALDATGNAAALDIFALLNIDIKGKTLLTWIKEKNSEVKKALANNPQTSEQYFNQLYNFATGVINTPATYELNKQILWPNTAYAIKNDSYQLLVPLYPSSLAHDLYQKVNLRYSDENKKNRENRFKTKSIKKSYFSLVDLAIVKLGGSNPQGVSQLASSQGGRHYLLPSTPPQLTERRGFYPRKSDTTLFTARLANYPLCLQGLEQMAAVIHNDRNNKRVRNQRDYGFDLIIAGLITIAKHLQKELGWSETYALNKNERLWLDKGYNPTALKPSQESIHQDNLPEKTQEVGQEVGQKVSQEISPVSLIENTWLREIERSFALWLNQQLKKRAGRKELFLDDIEVKNWRLNFREIVLQHQRRTEGVFYHV